MLKRVVEKSWNSNTPSVNWREIAVVEEEWAELVPSMPDDEASNFLAAWDVFEGLI